MYDYLVVGAGLFGAVFAHEVAKKAKKFWCLTRERPLPEIYLRKRITT